jgi:hypothetical protein
MTRRLIASLAASALAATAATAVAANTNGSNNSPTSTTISEDPSAYAKVVSVSPDQAAGLAVLRRATGPDDTIATDVAGPFGANLRLSRKVSAGGLTAWVIPANQHICIRSIDRGYDVWACAVIAAAVKGDLVLTLRDPETHEAISMFALVPDGVTSVNLERPGSARESVSVNDNVAITARTNAKTLSYTTQSGNLVTIPVP